MSNREDALSLVCLIESAQYGLQFGDGSLRKGRALTTEEMRIIEKALYAYAVPVAAPSTAAEAQPVAWQYRSHGSGHWMTTTKEVHDDYRDRGITECRELFIHPAAPALPEEPTAAALEAIAATVAEPSDIPPIIYNGDTKRDPELRRRIDAHIRQQVERNAQQQAEPEFGMTLRDYFAAKALETVVAYPQEDTQHWTPDNFAAHAYEVADAMLRARGAKQ